MRYHIEIFRDRNIVKVQGRANAYLEECEKLEAQVTETHLQWMDSDAFFFILPDMQILAKLGKGIAEIAQKGLDKQTQDGV